MLQIGEEIPGLLCLDRVVLHNAAEVIQQNPFRVKTPRQAWAYAAAFEVQREGPDSEMEFAQIVVELGVHVHDGEVCIGGLTQDLQEFVGMETVVTARAGAGRVRVLITEPARFRWLMLRKGASGDRPAIFSLDFISCYRAGDGQPADLCEVPTPELQNQLGSPRPLAR
jgi:hypothetical protein